MKNIPRAGPLTLDRMTMEIKDITSDVKLEISKDGRKGEAVLMNYLYYKSYQEEEGQRSGAYIFRPSQPDEKPENYNGFYTYDGFQGKFITQMRLYGSQVNLSITGNILTDFVELETNLFGIPLSEQGQEVILHFSFDKIKNDGVFYTDSMGLEMQERRVDYRPTWDLYRTQPVSENYYPINHGITIKDDKMTLEILNDRSQGGTSLEDGTVEFMIQRRTYEDDSRGVGEALNETDPFSSDGKGLGVITKHYIRFYNNTVDHTITENSRWMQREIDNPLLYVYGIIPSERKLSELKQGSLTAPKDLPDQVKAVLLPQKDGSFFLRLENILDLISSDEVATVNVQKIAESLLIGSYNVKKVTEVSNTGLYDMEEMQSLKLKWKGADYTTPKVDYTGVDLTAVDLEPQRIRSFVFEYEQISTEDLASE